MNCWIIWLILSSIMLGCNYNHIKKTPDGSISEKNVETPDFKAVQSGIFESKCLSCHSNSGGNKGQLNMESYQRIKAARVRIGYRTLEAQDMPPDRPLAPKQLEMLRNWLEAGAPETISGPSEKPDPELEKGLINWVKIRDKIFTPKCLDCHSSPEPQGGLDLTKLAEVRGRSPMIFDRVIIKQDMPLSPYPAATPRERRVLLKWFDLGMPE